jgi:cytidine deaminase
MDVETLARQALAARERAYAPYSRFRVGAALLAADGTLYTGANVENASYPLSNCAERVAIQSAVAAGARAFSAMAVASAGGVAPCGACRQVLYEFAPGMQVHLVDEGGTITTFLLGELLPRAFGPRALGG